VRAAERFAIGVRLLFVGVGLLLALTMWQTYRALHRTLGGKIDQIHRQIERLGRGDFSAPIALDKAQHTSVLGWLAETQQHLQAAQRDANARPRKSTNWPFSTSSPACPTGAAARPLDLGHEPAQRPVWCPSVHRPRPLQDPQRHQGPRHGRPAAAASRRTAQALRARRRHGGIGGDEFVVLLGGLGATAQAAAGATEAIAERMLNALEQPYTLRGTPHHSSASMGATLFQAAPRRWTNC
jgi:hypothetical protein